MNKVFKVIWSEARNAYVVVSEIAKNHGSKSCSTKKLLAMLIATGVMTCASMAPAMAADPPAEALKHSTVTNGANITVTEDTNKDGGKEYKVALNNDITLAGDDPDALVGISGSKGTIWATGSVTVGSGVDGSVVMDGTTATVSGLGNTTTAYAGFANGKGKAATEEQLKEVATEAGKHSVVTEGANITVTPEQAEDGRMQYNVALKNDIKLAGDNDYTYVNISGSKGSVWASSSVAAGNVIMDGTTATVSGLGNTTTAYDGFATTGKAATEEQLKEVATEAGKHSKVVNGNNTNVEETTVDGQKVYKVNLNNNIMVGDVTGKYVSISGTNGTIEATGAIATKDRVYADKGAKLADIDVTGNKISNGASSIVLDGSNVKVNDKVTIDQNGNIAGVNSLQTNALNSKYNLSVGTMAENGIMPFFVNSTGDFYAAHNKFHVDKDGKVTATAGEIGNVVLQNGVYYGHSTLQDGSLLLTDDNGNHSYIDAKSAKLGKVTVAEDGKISGVAAGEISSTSTDAINGSQLKETNDRVTKNEQDIAQNKADIAALDNRVTQNEADIAANRADIDKNKADIAANRTDIDKNAADIAQNKTDIKNLDNRVTNVEELAKKHTTVTQGDNITVTEGLNADGGKDYNVALNKDINLDSVTTGQTVMNNDGLKVGKDVSVTATAVTAGKTSISDEGVKVGNNTYISDKGLNANGQYITNVKAGEADTDAVNYGQLKDTNNHIDRVENQVVNNTNRINKLGSRVNKVGAGAAALAALHPMDFDPDDKLTFSAGYGNYGGENAAAIGAYYRPDEKVMFSVAGTVGNGENMVNAGVSFALDRTNHVSNSRTALAREVIDLRGQLAVMGAKMAKMEKAFGMLDETKTKLFPDVPANHWAYEYIAKLAGNGYIEGYPDGNFGGDRLMTRYEFAAMLYRAIENGAALEEKIIKEFEPELGRIRVDRISGEDGDRDKIERVRVNDTKGERDHYGNKLAK